MADQMADVTSFTLVWIKIQYCLREAASIRVTSFTLVWIKMLGSLFMPRDAGGHELHARVD